MGRAFYQRVMPKLIHMLGNATNTNLLRVIKNPPGSTAEALKKIPRNRPKLVNALWSARTRSIYKKQNDDYKVWKRTDTMFDKQGYDELRAGFKPSYTADRENFGIPIILKDQGCLKYGNGACHRSSRKKVE